MKHTLGESEDFNIVPQNNQYFDETYPFKLFAEYNNLMEWQVNAEEMFTGDTFDGVLKNIKSPIMVIDHITYTGGIDSSFNAEGLWLSSFEIEGVYTCSLKRATKKIPTPIVNPYTVTEIDGGISPNCIYYVKSTKHFYYYGGSSAGFIEIKFENPNKALTTVSAPSSGTTYTITPFAYSVLNPTTSTVDIALSSQTDNTVDYEYTLEINGSDITENSVTAINFPSTLIWEGNNVPDIADFLTLNYTAWIIEIRNGKYASYKRYWNG